MLQLTRRPFKASTRLSWCESKMQPNWCDWLGWFDMHWPCGVTLHPQHPLSPCRTPIACLRLHRSPWTIWNAKQTSAVKQFIFTLNWGFVSYFIVCLQTVHGFVAVCCVCLCLWRTSLLSYTATWLVLNVCWALLRAVNRNRYANCCAAKSRQRQQNRQQKCW